MATILIGALIIAIVSAFCWLAYEFVNAPLVDDDEQLLP